MAGPAGLNMSQIEPVSKTKDTSSSLESTRELLNRAREGDQSSLNRLLARYLPRFRRWASGRLPKAARDLVDTEDLVQETLLQTVRRLDHFENRDQGAFQAYVRAALQNRIRDQVRRTERRGVAASLPEELLAEEPTPIETVVGKETLARYEAALESLSPIEKEAVIGRIELGLSYRELAEALDKPTADAARMTVSRALVRLAEEMQK